MSDTIYLDPGFEKFLNRVYGKNRFHGFSGNKKKTEWKNILLNLFERLENHFEINIQNDSEQLHELKKHLSVIRKTLSRNKSINHTTVNTIRILFDMCFQLLGEQINNTERKVVNHHTHYKLNQKRTIAYFSNNDQKFWQVHSRAGTSRFLEEGFPTKIELEDFYFQDLKKDSDKFMKWFKDEYPDLYLEMF